jgi:hypothetical protein
MISGKMWMFIWHSELDSFHKSDSVTLNVWLLRLPGKEERP